MLRILAQVDLSDDMVSDESGVTAEFTYSVRWRETDVQYEKRMDKYRRYSFLPQHLEVGLFGLIIPLLQGF